MAEEKKRTKTESGKKTSSRRTKSAAKKTRVVSGDGAGKRKTKTSTKTEPKTEAKAEAKTKAKRTRRKRPAKPKDAEPKGAEPAVVLADAPSRDSGFGAGILDFLEPPEAVPAAAATSVTSVTIGETGLRGLSPGPEPREGQPDKAGPRRKTKRGRRGRKSKKPAQAVETSVETVDDKPGAEPTLPVEDHEKTARKPRKRRRGGRSKKADEATHAEAAGPPVAPEPAPPSHLDAGMGFAEGLDFESPDEPLRDEPATAIAAPPPAPSSERGGREKPEAEPAKPPRVKGKASADSREMLINVSDADECRIAMLCEGRLEELYTERATATSNVGNIYKGRVTNVESSIQAAFVDFGLSLHGFLHISDLHPKYFPESKGEPELVGKKTPRRHRPPIQHCLRRGAEIIVQVIKEGIGTKGPTLSSYISLPGRFLVMMPGMEQLGVSRKIEDEDQRRKLRDSLSQLALPKGMGFIVRTAGVDRTKRDLQRDLNYLSRLWKKVDVRIKNEPAPATLYKESDLVIRTIRDVYDSSLSKIIVDSKPVADRVREFLSIASPRAQDVVELYDGREPMFHRYGIESEIDKLHSRHVSLPCGGSLVIESTEALVAIDVNSGRFRVPENAEETAYRVNLEAVDEIARQLRLRDLGGLIICDLIDMSFDRHRRVVEKRLADALKKHKERAEILHISRFGILEMTRQRQRPSFAKSIFQDCQRCGGSGRVKTAESAGLDVMRQIRLASHRAGVICVDVGVSPLVASDLLNRKRAQLTDLERATGQTIRIHARPDLNVEAVQISCADRRGREVPQDGDHATPHGEAAGRLDDAAGDKNRDDRSKQRAGASDSKGGRRRRGGRRRGK
ncbi:MAG: Rne/Rng family ribonuclease [Planctomycetota bacterium]